MSQLLILGDIDSTALVLFLLFCMFGNILHENTGADNSWRTIPVPIPTSSPTTTKGATVKKPGAFTDLWIPKVKRGKSGKTGMAGKADSDRGQTWFYPALC